MLSLARKIKTLGIKINAKNNLLTLRIPLNLIFLMARPLTGANFQNKQRQSC